MTGAKGKLYAREVDITKTESIQSGFDWVEKEFGKSNILINCAGTAGFSTLIGPDSKLDHIINVIDVNLTGVAVGTKLGYDLMSKTDEYGHIINIGSFEGHKVLTGDDLLPMTNTYPATKHAIRAMSEVLRQELNVLNQKVKVSQISPGFTKTNILDACGIPNGEALWADIKHLNPEDIADAALYILGTPPHVQVHDMIVKAVGEKF